MNRRGRPPKLEGELTPAERKAAQRDRDRAAMRDAGCAAIGELSTSALVEGLPEMIAIRGDALFGAVLIELSRRGGLTLRLSPRRNPTKKGLIRF